MATAKKKSTGKTPTRRRSPSLIYVLNGPNLNLLGAREPDIYGRQTLEDVEGLCHDAAGRQGLKAEFRQSNHEGELVDWVQEAGSRAKGLIFNPAAYSHTSIALHDALKAISIPKIEVHLSNIASREEFRRHSMTAMASDGAIAGFGVNGYVLALDAMSRLLEKRT